MFVVSVLICCVAWPFICRFKLPWYDVAIILGGPTKVKPTYILVGKI